MLGKERDPFTELEKEVSILLGEMSSSKITKRKLAKYNLQYIHVYTYEYVYIRTCTCIYTYITCTCMSNRVLQ